MDKLVSNPGPGDDAPCNICGGKGTAQIVLQAGPNPHVSPPLDCPQCNGGDWEVWECLMPSGWNRGKWWEEE